MKILCFFLLMIPVLLFGQTDELNLQKYWKFRNTFLEQYIKIGPDQGESLPAGYRVPGTCVDNISQWASDEYGTMAWGDGIIRQGHYLGLLSTEYALRKKNGLDLRGIRNELYYALAAINRLDLVAESALNEIYFAEDFYEERLNGFYLREDVGEDFCQHWANESMNMGCVYSAYYENNNVAKINDPDIGLKVKDVTSYQNVPSLDQMSSVMIGLSLVHKLVEDDFVQPTAEDKGFKLKSEAIAIVDRMVSYAAERNWQIIDVNGWPVGNGGGDLALASAPILEAVERMVGNTDEHSKWASRRMQKSANVQYCLTGYGLSSDNRENTCDNINFFSVFENKAWRELQTAYPAGNLNNQDESVFMDWLKHGVIKLPVRRIKWVWKKVAARSYPALYSDLHDDGKMSVFPWPLSEIQLDNEAVTHYNNTIFFNLGVLSGWWDSTQVHDWANVTENRQLELINALLYNQKPIEAKEFYKNYLDGMSPEGGYRIKGSNCCPATETVMAYQDNGWASEYRWTHPSETYGDEGVEGIFSGLDYMLFHNLYYLLYFDELPQYQEDYQCFCGDAIKQDGQIDDSNAVLDARSFLNKKLRHLPATETDVFEGVQSIVQQPLIIEPKFSNYTDLKISTARFQIKDAIIEQGGDVELRTNLVICNGANLTIVRDGDLHAVNGDIQIRENSSIEVYGNLILEEGAQLKLRENTIIYLRKGATLIISEGATLSTEGNAIIELHPEATFEVAGEDNQRILEKVIKRM